MSGETLLALLLLLVGSGVLNLVFAGRWLLSRTRSAKMEVLSVRIRRVIKTYERFVDALEDGSSGPEITTKRKFHEAVQELVGLAPFQHMTLERLVETDASALGFFVHIEELRLLEAVCQLRMWVEEQGRRRRYV